MSQNPQAAARPHARNHANGSGGRSPSLLTQALGTPDDSAFRNRTALGFTYTTADNLSLTIGR